MASGLKIGFSNESSNEFDVLKVKVPYIKYSLFFFLFFFFSGGWGAFSNLVLPLGTNININFFLF